MCEARFRGSIKRGSRRLPRRRRPGARCRAPSRESPRSRSPPSWNSRDRRRGVDRLHAPLSRRLAVHRHYQRSPAAPAATHGRDGQRLYPRSPTGPARVRGATAQPVRGATQGSGAEAVAARRQAGAAARPVRLGRRDLAGLLVALAVAALCARLGFWQLDRLRQRRERNAVSRAAQARPLLEVTSALTLDSARERRLHASGVYDYAWERPWRPRSDQGAPGVALITPLKLADGSAVLVDRGWAPSPDAYHVDP